MFFFISVFKNTNNNWRLVFLSNWRPIQTTDEGIQFQFKILTFEMFESHNHAFPTKLHSSLVESYRMTENETFFNRMKMLYVSFNCILSPVFQVSIKASNKTKKNKVKPREYYRIHSTLTSYVKF